MKKYDYYYSAKADERMQRITEMQGQRNTICKFKGNVFIEAIAHGEKPTAGNETLKKEQTISRLR